MRILQAGHAEPLKAVVHGIGLVFCATCAGYSIAAALERRRVHGRLEAHLVFNGIAYTIATGWEAYHVGSHIAAARQRVDEGTAGRSALP